MILITVPVTVNLSALLVKVLFTVFVELIRKSQEVESQPNVHVLPDMDRVASIFHEVSRVDVIGKMSLYFRYGISDKRCGSPETNK